MVAPLGAPLMTACSLAETSVAPVASMDEGTRMTGPEARADARGRSDSGAGEALSGPAAPVTGAASCGSASADVVTQPAMSRDAPNATARMRQAERLPFCTVMRRTSPWQRSELHGATRSLADKHAMTSERGPGT